MQCPTCMRPLWRWAPAPRSSCPAIPAFTCWGSRCCSAKIKESGATLCQAVNVRHRRKPLSDYLICLLTWKGVSNKNTFCQQWRLKKRRKKNSARSLIIFPCPVCVSQECPVGLLILWRTACFRGRTFMPAALWSISVTPAFTCWETPKCTVPTVESGVEIHQLVSVRHKRTLFSSVIQRKEKLTCKKKNFLCAFCVCVCSDVDECALGSDCDEHASCQNTEGSYTCTCTHPYSGDGKNCTGNEDLWNAIKTLGEPILSVNI